MKPSGARRRKMIAGCDEAGKGEADPPLRPLPSSHEQLSKQGTVSIPLPRGSAHVKDAAKTLSDFAKLQFRITKEL